jgi:hypothetical protein
VIGCQVELRIADLFLTSREPSEDELFRGEEAQTQFERAAAQFRRYMALNVIIPTGGCQCIQGVLVSY